MRRVFVVGASLPAGGAYMAYRLGRFIAMTYKMNLVNVEPKPGERGLFEYDASMQTISLPELDRMIGDEDVLVSMPAFSSYLFGARLPGRKIMYAQGFNTHGIIDGHFDLYVSASRPVQRYLSSVWGIESPLIAPCIAIPPSIPIRPWHERPHDSMAIFIKKDGAEARLLLDMLRSGLARRGITIADESVLTGRALKQDAFLTTIASARYFVNLTMAEGFGLVPLEAMALGTMVTGLDGLAGRDYMRYGENSLTCSFRELNTLPDLVFRAMRDEGLAERCAQAGMETVKDYSTEIFEESWLTQLRTCLGRSPT
jgi:hypothetical protein